MKRLLLLTTLLVLASVGVAKAATVPLQSVTPSNYYSWCGKSALNSLLPDATPPAGPYGCGEYAGSSASLTGQLAPTAGRLTVSEYVNDAGITAAVHLIVNGTTVSTVNVPLHTAGWLTFPATSVQQSDVVTVNTGSTWVNASGQIKVQNIHADLQPWQQPDWSQIGDSGNWSTTPIPSNVTLDATTGPRGLPNQTEVPRQLQLQAKGTAYPNFDAYTEHTYYVPLNTPLQPVRLCRQAGGTTQNCIPNWGAAIDFLWRAAEGVANNAGGDRQTGICGSNCTSIGGGIPMTADVQPAPGTDEEAVVCLGGGDSGDPPWTLKNADGTPFVRPDGQMIQGNCWELWGLQADPNYDPNQPISTTNTKWTFKWGAHRTGFIRSLGSTDSTVYGTALDTLSGKYCPRTPAGQWKCGSISDATAQKWFGPDVLTPGAGDSTTYIPGWGVTAAELPLMTDVVQQHDCQAVLNGQASDFGHAIGIQLRYDRAEGYGYSGARWPAGNSDGNNGNVAPVEGMRLFWPSSVTMPAVLNAAAQAVFRTVQKYGLAIDDTTGGGTGITYNADGTVASGGALNVRYELGPTSGTNQCKALGWPDLGDLPWSQLKLIAVGDEGTANHTQ